MQERGAFTLVLAGGSLFKALAPLARAAGVDWGRWHVFFVDERNVPHSSPDSNFNGADEALLSKVRLEGAGVSRVVQPACTMYSFPLGGGR